MQTPPIPIRGTMRAQQVSAGHQELYMAHSKVIGPRGTSGSTPPWHVAEISCVTLKLSSKTITTLYYK